MNAVEAIGRNTRLMLRRPDLHLERLTLPFRWEATRRHPVYLQLWQVYRANECHTSPTTWETLRQNGDIVNACNAIRLISEPVDPTTDFDELTKTENGSLFFSSALQPVSVKGLLSSLTQSLSSDTLRQIGTSLQAVANAKDGTGDPIEVLSGVADLMNSTNPEMEGLLDSPIYTVSPIAPREQIQKDVADCQEHWRNRLGLEKTRARLKDYPNYLRIWDACEGYHNGRYCRDRIQSFAAVSRDTNTDDRTVRRWYRQAFYLISGREYSIDNWRSLMGIQQLSAFFGFTVSDASRERLRLKPQKEKKKEVDFSTVQQGSDLIETAEREQTATDFQIVVRQIAQMVSENATEVEIMDRIEIEFGSQEDFDEDQIREGIKVLRQRDDLLTDILSEG